MPLLLLSELDEALVTTAPRLLMAFDAAPLGRAKLGVREADMATACIVIPLQMQTMYLELLGFFFRGVDRSHSPT